jgi:hypothetical protein
MASSSGKQLRRYIAPLEWRGLKLGQTDRAIFIGATGSGKTTLARYLIEDEWKPYSVVYDAKGESITKEWPSSPSRHVVYEDFAKIQTAKEPRLIYHPSVEEEHDRKAQDEFFRWVYHRKYTRLYVDEAYSLLGGSNPSHYLQACLSRGRERGISTMVATQRPSRIPLITLSEAEHYFVFRLHWPADRVRVEEITGINVMDIPDDNFDFVYWSALTGRRTGKLKLNLFGG